MATVIVHCIDNRSHTHLFVRQSNPTFFLLTFMLSNKSPLSREDNIGCIDNERKVPILSSNVYAVQGLLETVEDSSVADGGVGTWAAVAVVVVAEITGVQVMEDLVLEAAVAVMTEVVKPQKAVVLMTPRTKGTLACSDYMLEPTTGSRLLAKEFGIVYDEGAEGSTTSATTEDNDDEDSEIEAEPANLSSMRPLPAANKDLRLRKELWASAYYVFRSRSHGYIVLVASVYWHELTTLAYQNPGWGSYFRASDSDSPRSARPHFPIQLEVPTYASRTRLTVRFQRPFCSPTTTNWRQQILPLPFQAVASSRRNMEGPIFLVALALCFPLFVIVPSFSLLTSRS
ncbi:hypothetical protein BGY98DRAFT_1173847 [Russula aff. rugulosa BPL654]|nr:hypothetical protein BGY98DRAFT_1173847 [Russula aff. rugulosa BPL654]